MFIFTIRVAMWFQMGRYSSLFHLLYIIERSTSYTNIHLEKMVAAVLAVKMVQCEGGGVELIVCVGHTVFTQLLHSKLWHQVYHQLLYEVCIWRLHVFKAAFKQLNNGVLYWCFIFIKNVQLCEELIILINSDH